MNRVDSAVEQHSPPQILPTSLTPALMSRTPLHMENHDGLTLRKKQKAAALVVEGTKTPCCIEELSALKAELKTSVIELYKMHKMLYEEFKNIKL